MVEDEVNPFEERDYNLMGKMNQRSSELTSPIAESSIINESSYNMGPNDKVFMNENVYPSIDIMDQESKFN